MTDAPTPSMTGELGARKPITHDLKTWPEPFAAIRARLKPWELRFNDRNFRVGDTLHLREWSEATGYTGETEQRVVAWMLDGGQFGLPKGYVIMSLATPSLPGEVRDGWVLVPREPTEEMMLRARRDDGVEDSAPASFGQYYRNIYRAMVAAAPEHPSSMAETCIACGLPMKSGDEYLPDIGGGFLHFACCGPEPESFVNLETGEQLPEIPKPRIWED